MSHNRLLSDNNIVNLGFINVFVSLLTVFKSLEFRSKVRIFCGGFLVFCFGSQNVVKISMFFYPKGIKQEKFFTVSLNRLFNSDPSSGGPKMCSLFFLTVRLPKRGIPLSPSLRLRTPYLSLSLIVLDLKSDQGVY